MSLHSFSHGLPSVALIALVTLSASAADEVRPATVAEASSVLNLGSIPLMDGAKVLGPRRLAYLSYSAVGDPSRAFLWHASSLEADGWTKRPGGYQGAGSSTGVFSKAGYLVSLATNPAAGPGSSGKVDVSMRNHGNVDLGKLPVPADAKPLYKFPTTVAYLSGASAADAAESLGTLWKARGWEPYGVAGDTRFYRQNAIRLSARCAVAPAQAGKTTIQLSAELLSAEIPAPPTWISASYADATKALALDIDMTADDLARFYRKSLGLAGWTPTTDAPFKVDFREMLIFRDQSKAFLTLMTHRIDGKLRANLEHRTAEEYAEEIRLAEESDAKLKGDARERAMRDAEATAKLRIKVAIPLPAGARETERSKSDLGLRVASGKAKIGALEIRDGLVKEGWKAKDATLETLAGSIILKEKGGAIVTITYVDAGPGDAEVKVSTVGADIAPPSAR